MLNQENVANVGAVDQEAFTTLLSLKLVETEV
jgi:hypothetical protein